MELSFFEIILVGVIAFLVLGPAEMVRLAHRLGQWVGKFKTEARNFRIMAEEQLLKPAQDLEKDVKEGVELREIEKNLLEKASPPHGLE